MADNHLDTDDGYFTADVAADHAADGHLLLMARLTSLMTVIWRLMVILTLMMVILLLMALHYALLMVIYCLWRG